MSFRALLSLSFRGAGRRGTPRNAGTRGVLQSPAVMELRPFRSLRYSRAAIAARGLDALIAPLGAPADSAAPDNVAGLASADDPEAAAAALKEWLASVTLEKERRPGLWGY